MDSIQSAIEALRTEAATYPDGVQLWMRVMSITYFLGLPLAFLNRRTLWIGGAAVLTAATLIVGKMLWPDVARDVIGAWAHIVIWPVALLATWRSGDARPGLAGGAGAKLVFVWALFASALMVVSLGLDVGGLFRAG